MWLKELCICLIFLSSQTLGQNFQNSQVVPNLQSKIPDSSGYWGKSILKECYSGPIVWSNCHETGLLKFPEVRH